MDQKGPPVNAMLQWIFFLILLLSTRAKNSLNALQKSQELLFNCLAPLCIENTWKTLKIVL